MKKRIKKIISSGCKSRTYPKTLNCSKLVDRNDGINCHIWENLKTKNNPFGKELSMKSNFAEICKVSQIKFFSVNNVATIKI